MGNCYGQIRKYLTWHARRIEKTILLPAKCLLPVKPSTLAFRFFFSPVAQRPNAGHGLLILEVSRSHTTTHHSR